MAAAKRSAALARRASRTAGRAASPSGSSARPRRRAIRSRPSLTKYRSLARARAPAVSRRASSRSKSTRAASSARHGSSTGPPEASRTPSGEGDARSIARPTFRAAVGKCRPSADPSRRVSAGPAASHVRAASERRGTSLASSASMLAGSFTSLDRLIEPERQQEARGALPGVLPGIGPGKAEFVHRKAAVDLHRPDVLRMIAVLEARRDRRRSPGLPGELHVDQRIALPDFPPARLTFAAELFHDVEVERAEFSRLLEAEAAGAAGERSPAGAEELVGIVFDRRRRLTRLGVAQAEAGGRRRSLEVRVARRRRGLRPGDHLDQRDLLGGPRRRRRRPAGAVVMMVMRLPVRVPEAARKQQTERCEPAGLHGTPPAP